MNKRYVSGLLAVMLLYGAGPVFAQQQADKSAAGNGPPSAPLPSVPLLDVLDAVGAKSNMTFIVNAGVPSRVVVGPLRTRDITYASMLTILGNNGLATVTIGDEVSIIPVGPVRQHPLPLITERDDSIAAQEWVTWIVPLTTARAEELVPILRPLMPRPGHLAANVSTNSLLIVDRYANARRVRDVLLRMDEMAETRAGGR